MLRIQKTLISLDIIERKFSCNVQKCKGICCVEGDYGAPLETNEIKTLKEDILNIKSYMTPLAISLYMEYGFYEIDPEDDYVTRCLSSGGCIFTFTENGIYKCAVEKAWADGKIEFQKPISCHLYPVRLNAVGDIVGVNYNKWDICKPACEYGEENSIPLYVFLKESLIRRFGKKWYRELESIAIEIK